MEIVAERLLLTIKLTLAGICRAVLLELPLGVSSLYFQRKTTGEAVLTDFPQVQIEPLENEAIESFLLYCGGEHLVPKCARCGQAETRCTIGKG